MDVLLLDTFSGKYMFIVVLLYLYLGLAAMSACLESVTMSACLESVTVSACLGSVTMSVCLTSRRVKLGSIAMSSLEKACLSWQTRQTRGTYHYPDLLYNCQYAFCLFVVKNRLCTETGKGTREDIRESKQTFVACGDNQLVDN